MASAAEPLIVIVGETASGKSALAMDVAKKFNGEIICADAWTVRKGLDIGTAKPSKRDQTEVKHHLLDIIEPDEPFTAAMFKDLANRAIEDICNRGKLPIMVGGTFLYVDAVLREYTFADEGNPNQRDTLNSKSKDELLEIIRKKQYDLTGIDICNKRRLVRLIEAKGQKPKQSPMRPNTLMLGTKKSRAVIRRLIEQRVEQMFASGLKHEVEALSRQYGWDIEALKAIGYREWQAYFNGQLSREQTKRKIVSNTLSRLAKRQRSWFNKNTNIIWVEKAQAAQNVVKNFLVQ